MTDERKTDGTNKAKQMKTDLQILEESLDYIGSTINTNDVLVCMQIARQDERDKLKDGEWLSPIDTEREWQESQLKLIAPHFPNASPRWQYMNMLIKLSLLSVENSKKVIKLEEYVRHKDTCNISNWVESGDVKCNCGLDDLNYKFTDKDERSEMNGWINSNDQTPNDRGFYIVMDAKLNCVQFNNWDRLKNRWVFNHEYITHWMALRHIALPHGMPELTRIEKEKVVKDKIGVYCKCNKLIVISETQDKKINSYWDKGYRIGKISSQFARDNFGCQC